MVSHQPMAVAASSDGRWALVANRQGSSVVKVDLTHQAPISHAQCNCSPTILLSLAGNSVFLLTPPGTGPLSLFDGDAPQPRILLIARCPTAQSSRNDPMNNLSVILSRGLRCGVLVASLRITILAQNIPSTTVLSTNTPALVLPGSLTLTSTVNQPVVPGGVPTGSVAFTADGTTPLGSAPLKSLPLTQSFPMSPTASISSLNSAGLVAVDLLGTRKPVLVVGNDFVSSCSGAATVFVFLNLGGGKFNGPGASPVCLQSSSPIDKIASGSFLNTGTESALVHQPGFYYLVNGTINSGVPTITVTPGSHAGPQSSSADNELIAIDDFDGDGYSDVGVIVVPDEFTPSPIVGIALNELNPANGSRTFGSLIQAELPTAPAGESGQFVADAITTGKFNSALKPELAVLGHFGTGANSYVVLYAAPTDGLTPIGAPQSVGANQSVLTSADFNQDGKLDLLVGSSDSQTGADLLWQWRWDFHTSCYCQQHARRTTPFEYQ